MTKKMMKTMKMTSNFFVSLILFLTLFLFSLCGQTIAEKKVGILRGTGDLTPELEKLLKQVNEELRGKKALLFELHEKVGELYEQGAPSDQFREFLFQIKEIKEEIQKIQEKWYEKVLERDEHGEGYALWHQLGSTLDELVSDFGASDFVYLIPPEVGRIRVSLSSNIPVPRAFWEEMLEQILIQNGVGIRQLNPYLRQLYFLYDDFSDLKLITNHREDLGLFQDNARVSFVLTPDPTDFHRSWLFLEKFVNPVTTVLRRVGRNIFLIGDVATLRELLKIHDFVEAHKGEIQYKAIPLFRVDAEEMAKILAAIFEGLREDVKAEEIRPKDKKIQSKIQTKKEERVGGLYVIPLAKVARAVFLIGTEREVKKAEEIIKEVENQVGEAREKEIFWYQVKYSDPEELAQVLERIYLLIVEKETKEKREDESQREIPTRMVETQRPPRQPEPIETYKQSFYQEGEYVINPRPIAPQPPEKKQANKDRQNFIVDLKSNNIVMVVETDLLPRMKDLIKKLDVPKKMVNIEVLLFERRLSRTNQYGMNLLRIGTDASQTHAHSVLWNDIMKVNGKEEGAGIFEYLLSRVKTSSGIPAFDLIYRFLMTQDDIHINANPSVVAINQTPATIAVKDEISINTGVYQVETSSGVTLQDAFTRSQYGITIIVTPTIHSEERDFYYGNELSSITLKTDITFDTILPSLVSSRPDVNRRNITNEVRILDGQTVILGGLRRRNSGSARESIPFLGELPGIGKLFRITALQDNDTEMFVFMTPKVISDPMEDFEKIKRKELFKRPGDLPAFLMRLNEALECEKNRLLQGTMTILFGPQPPRYICPQEESHAR